MLLMFNYIIDMVLDMVSIFCLLYNIHYLNIQIHQICKCYYIDSNQYYSQCNNYYYNNCYTMMGINHIYLLSYQHNYHMDNTNICRHQLRNQFDKLGRQFVRYMFYMGTYIMNKWMLLANYNKYLVAVYLNIELYMCY